MDDADLIAKIGKKRYRRRLERDRYFTQAINPSSLSSPSPPNPTMAANGAAGGGNKLAQEIHEEFLTCKICLEGFKSPKCLDCLHTFCEQCIDNHVLNECTYKKYSDYRDFTCPLCRKRTQLPIGGVKKLPDNFLVSSLGEVVSRQKPSKFPFCDICKLINRKHREATSKCIDCNKLLCKQCVDMHMDTKVTMNHSMFDVEIEKEIECKEHQEEVVRFYCEPCQSCICVLCTFNEHKDHEISQFTDAVSKYKENIQQLLVTCKGKIDIYDKQLALINKCEGVIKSAEQRVRDAAIQFMTEIRNKEKSLIEDLHALYGPELMEYVGRKNEMQNNLDGLKSTCSLTEMVLKGKDIELLLLKKQVQDKLSVMANVELKDLPTSVGKQISFEPGSIDLGKLEDVDKALEKKKEEPAAGEAIQEETQKFGLPNMVFGQRGSGWARPRTDVDHTQKEVPKRATATQTDPVPVETPAPTTAARPMNRAVQTDFLLTGLERSRETSSTNSSMGRQSVGLESRSTETDVIRTVEKAVNTPSRSLQAMTQQLQQTSTGTSTTGGSTMTSANREESPRLTADSSSGLELSSSPAPRRHRRRRERVKPVEVSVRPTTGAVGPISSFSSSSSTTHREVSSDGRANRIRT